MEGYAVNRLLEIFVSQNATNIPIINSPEPGPSILYFLKPVQDDNNFTGAL
jgi:hypothetical protein